MPDSFFFFLPPVKNKCYTANKADAWLPNAWLLGFQCVFFFLSHQNVAHYGWC